MVTLQFCLFEVPAIRAKPVGERSPHRRRRWRQDRRITSLSGEPSHGGQCKSKAAGNRRSAGAAVRRRVGHPVGARVPDYGERRCSTQGERKSQRLLLGGSAGRMELGRHVISPFFFY